MQNNDLLVDKTRLLEMYPAFSKWTLDWLIRNRSIPIVKIGRRIYFDPSDVRTWVDSKKINPLEEANNGIRFNKN
jgi:predicted DNA-binding transcriptional regulator AlpA